MNDINDLVEVAGTSRTLTLNDRCWYATTDYCETGLWDYTAAAAQHSTVYNNIMPRMLVNNSTIPTAETSMMSMPMLSSLPSSSTSMELANSTHILMKAEHFTSSGDEPNSSKISIKEDINSIESIPDVNEVNIPNDVMVLEVNNEEVLNKNKRKKKKKQCDAKAALDQLDGTANHSKRGACSTNSDANDGTGSNGDEKVVKCLYYSLMCCDCTIS